jgi:pyruvate dehydrogenase E2 component (dihydrolipoamide acetyltransferase)
MEQGTFVEWLKRDGEAVRAGEPLFVLEGDKSAQDVEALEGGTLRLPPDSPAPGATVAVGALLGYLLAPSEVPPWEVVAPPQAITEPMPPEAAPVPPAPRPRTDSPRGTPPMSPRARRVAAELGIETTTLIATGSTGRIRERDVRVAARLMTALHPRGRQVALTTLRRTIAERMLASARQTAPVTLTTRADATNLVNVRRQFQAGSGAGEVAPSYTHLLVKLAAAALVRDPELNAIWDGDRLLLAEGVHVGVAVETAAGLLVPVVHDVANLGLRALAQQANELVDLARAGRLAPEQMQGGTFTVTNLGMHQIDAFTPILNWPQVAILGVGRIVREPAVDGERIIIRDALSLSLTFDHRAVDGAPAARYLNSLRGMVEQPCPWLVP